MSSDLLHGFVEQIELRKIVPSRRPLRNELGRIDELAASILEKGLLSPIVVRPLEGGRGFEVVAGNRRLEACRKLRMVKLPCHITELDDKGAYEISLLENIQRKSLNHLEEANAFRRYVDEFGYGSASDLARKIGKNPSYISRRLALLKLPDHVQEELLRAAKLGMAQELLALDDAEDIEMVTGLIVERSITTTDEIRSIVKRVKAGSSLDPLLQRVAPVSSSYADDEARRNGLDRAFGKCISSMRVCMMRLDEVTTSLDEDEWVVRDTIMRYRNTMHKRIDSLMNLRKRTKSTLPPA